MNPKLPLEERARRGSAAVSPLCPLEVYDHSRLEQDLLNRRPIRVSVPEAVARLQGLKHLDWSGEVELPPSADAPECAPEPPTALEQRYRALLALTHRLHGRILCTMLGGDRYAVRIDWGDAQERQV